MFLRMRFATMMSYELQNLFILMQSRLASTMRFITHNHGGAHDIVFLYKRKRTNKLWLHNFHQIIKSYVDIPFITSSYRCVWVSQRTTDSLAMTHMYLRLKDRRYYHLRNTCDFIHEVNLSSGLFNTYILNRY